MPSLHSFKYERVDHLPECACNMLQSMYMGHRGGTTRCRAIGIAQLKRMLHIGDSYYRTQLHTWMVS